VNLHALFFSLCAFLFLLPYVLRFTLAIWVFAALLLGQPDGSRNDDEKERRDHVWHNCTIAKGKEALIPPVIP